MSLSLYKGKAGTGGVGMRDVPLDPAKCPVEVVENGRVTYWSQCSRKPKANTFRPVDGEMLSVCGTHAGVHDRAQAKEKAWSDTEARQRAAEARIKATGVEEARLVGSIFDRNPQFDRVSIPLELFEQYLEERQKEES